jgi:hypothetical protein
MLRAILDRLFGTRSTDGPDRGPDALVHVYSRGERFFIEASDRTRMKDAGFWVATGHVTELASHATDEEIGLAVLHELRRSRVEVAVPPRETKLDAGLFRAMGVRTRQAAMSGTRACLVTRLPETTTLRIEPLRNGGTSGDDRGYAIIEDKAIELPAKSPVGAVGEAIREALTRAILVG